MSSLQEAVDAEAERSGFSGVVRVDDGSGVQVEAAYGYADRAQQIPNRVDTLFATASGAKGFTALAVMSLVEDGVLDLSTTARSLLGDDLPLVGDDVTIEHLLAHTSGIGDYLDEDQVDDISDYVLAVPVHTLVDGGELPADPRRAPDRLPSGREVRLQQRRLRPAGDPRRAGQRDAVPRSRP